MNKAKNNERYYIKLVFHHPYLHSLRYFKLFTHFYTLTLDQFSGTTSGTTSTLCMCYPTAIMLSKTEFSNYLNSGKIDSQNYVRTIPTKAQNYISENKKIIDGWKNKPYFIKDNFKSDFTLNINNS